MSSFMAIIPTSILILLLHSFFSTDPLVVADDDSSVMAKLASAFHPPPPSWSTNVSSHDYCDWRYVSCDESKNVIAIDTRDYFMKGYLPTEIVNLSQLRVLSIKNNELSGTMPLLNNLTCLNTLTLSINNFSSLAPGFFQGLPTTIRELDMSYTSIAPWTMPLQLARLENLTLLRLDQINLTGPLPDIFQSLPLLRSLSLSRNNLTGHLPPSLAKTGLEILYLDNQGEGLSGTINLLSDITTLVRVDVSYNQFTGQIPDLSQLVNLSVLLLGNNQLSGVILPSLCSFPPQPLSVANNKLQGPLPKSLVGDPYQVVGNRFCTKTGGPCEAQVTILLEIAGALGYPLELFESWVGNDACASWKFLSCNSEKEIIGIGFGEQHFGGTISPAFANLTALRFIYLNGNNLHGSIPQNLANLTQLQVLDISNNSLSGEIPAFPQSLELNVTGNLMLEDPNLPKHRQHPPPTQTRKSKGRIKQKVVIIVASFMGTMLGALCIFLLGKRFSRYAGKEKVEICNQGKPISKSVIVDAAAKNKNQIEFQGIKLFTFEHLASLTDNFDSDNKLGQGGFGPVYKGTLENGIEVAVKRLAGASGQGSEEFMNEVMLISKLQHRNLIRLIGCCNEREENMLVYEYMPNKSLDAFLFDPDKRKILDWPKRFNIIQGICRGLLHLHKDSRLRIVHRDLKASNILLDMDLIPKISDFGIARIFNSTKDQGNTRRIMGTYGYMPPEYVLEGRFSQKCDVFSLGVLILEIVRGRRNSGLDDSDYSPSLLELAWRLWNEGNILCLVDPTISNACIHKEILRCIHVGLLCVQDLVTDRPAMTFVISMLSGDVTLPAPKLPIFIEWKGAGHFEVTQSECSSPVSFSVATGR